MTDIPEDIEEDARVLSSRWFPIGHHDEAALHEEICSALLAERLSERSRQIERDAKIAEEWAAACEKDAIRLGWNEAVAFAAAAIRAQEPK